MGKNNISEVESYLIPFKYRINPELINLDKHLAIKQANNNIGSKIKNFFKFNTKEENIQNTKEKIGKAYKQRLGSILKESGDSKDDLIRQEWNLLKSSITDPFDNFIEIYYNYTLKKEIVSKFGEKLAEVIEEILRDYKVTDNEKRYILEKAKENGMSEKKAEKLFDEYFSSKYEIAFSKLVFEICRDGKITDAEKNYLLEKSQAYNVDFNKIGAKLGDTATLINKIKKCFFYKKFYIRVLILYLFRFIAPNEKYIYENYMDSLKHYINEGEYIQSSKEIKKILIICIKKINKIVGYDIFKEEKVDYIDIFNSLGINVIDHKVIGDRLAKLSVNDLENDISKALKYLKSKMKDYGNEKSQDIQLGENTYTIGQRTYKITIYESKSDPLFNYRIRGLNVTIFVNRKHYFYNDTLYFKKLIVSIVHNLISNHSYENLVDEVKMLTNPPASIKINYPKE